MCTSPLVSPKNESCKVIPGWDHFIPSIHINNICCTAQRMTTISRKQLIYLYLFIFVQKIIITIILVVINIVHHTCQLSLIPTLVNAIIFKTNSESANFDLSFQTDLSFLYTSIIYKRISRVHNDKLYMNAVNYHFLIFPHTVPLYCVTHYKQKNAAD